MDYKRRIHRNQIIFVVASFAILIGCGFLIGFSNLFKTILFILPIMVLFPAGLYFVVMHFDGKKQFFLFALWIGFIFALSSIVGMLMDERAYPLNWMFILSFAGIIWLIVFLFVIIFTPMLSKIMRLFVRK